MSDKAKSRLMIAGAALCAALFLFSGAMLAREYLDQKQSAEAFAEVADLVKEDVEPPTLELADDPAPKPEELTAFEKYADVYAQNSDLVGWISIPGTRIDYPVMQTKDTPNFYLKHAFDKSYSSYGVPYMQENCDVGISDNLVLYGHHMNNGSMFSDLCKYESEDFYREHKTIRFDTLDSFGEYEVIAAFKTVAYSESGFKYYHFVRAEQEEDFDEFIAKCKPEALFTLVHSIVDRIYITTDGTKQKCQVYIKGCATEDYSDVLGAAGYIEEEPLLPVVSYMPPMCDLDYYSIVHHGLRKF